MGICLDCRSSSGKKNGKCRGLHVNTNSTVRYHPEAVRKEERGEKSVQLSTAK